MLRFLIAGATEPDAYAKRMYDHESLQDASLSGPDDHGTFWAEFDREGKSFPHAVLSAISDLMAVLPEAELLRVEQEDLLTLAAIARRLGRTHESVRLYARNKRGTDIAFPAPAGKLDEKTEVWRWTDVAAWWEHKQGQPVEGLQDELFLTVLNDALDMRRAAARMDLSDDTLAGVGDLLPAGLRSRRRRKVVA